MVSSTLPTLLCSASPVLDQKFQEEASRKGLLPAYAVAFAQFAEKYADLDAIVYDGVGHAINFTYRDIERSSNRLARNLAKFDVGAGDLIVTVAENRPEMAVLVLACMKLGSTFVPLASDLRIKDLHTVVAMYSPKLIVCDQPDYGPFLTPEGDQRQTILLPPFRAGDNILKTLMAEGSGAPLEVPQVSPNKASIIFSTSGSTGLPKGVMYSSESISRLADPTLLAVMQAQAPGEKVLMWVSMRGVCGTIMMLKHFLEGASLTLVDSYPSGPTLWSQLIDKHGIQTFLLFGAAMNQMIQELPDRRFEFVKKITYGGSCFAPALIQRSMGQFPNAAFTQAYGMTENLIMCSLAPQFHKHAGEASAEDLLRMSSAGKATFPEDLIIEDLRWPGSCMPPPPEKNGVGQICSRSGLVMMGYFANPEKTEEVMPDGRFVRSGDVGRISEDGFVYILGRIKEIIPTCKGFNVMPRDIEEVLYQHAAVGQASVVGICHPSGAGEAVVASVSVKAGCELSAADVKEHCKQLGMPTWQMPDAIHVVDGGLPTVGSKIAKEVLQSRSFRQEALVAELARARSKLSYQAKSDNPAPLHHSDRAHLAELDILFGDAVPALKGGEGDGFGDVRMCDWQDSLPSMTDVERESFILSARSLLASCK
mmetsp:Transcript_133179/g.425906  ORF Transcript_133179/g.425906 Transcript_133179/m.425906 type:complete len:651 (-) Transcript_133179:236-2188(-)